MISTSGLSQSKDTYTAEFLPLWFERIVVDTGNYYDIVKLYDDYWKSRKKPFDSIPISALQEIDLIQGYSYNNAIMKSYNFEIENDIELMYVKFEKWKWLNKDYIDSNGVLLSNNERIRKWMKVLEMKGK